MRASGRAMWWSVITKVLLLAACTLTSALDDPRVTLDQGSLRGKTLKSRGGKQILTFRGIPYAAPPVGNLRFKVIFKSLK